MERSKDQSIKEILTEMGVLIRRLWEVYLERKENQLNTETVIDYLEPKSQEEEQYVETSPGNMEGQDFVNQGESDGEKRKLKEDITHSGGIQQTQEDMDYINGSNDWKHNMGEEERAGNQYYYWREEWENGIEDHIKFLKKGREKRKKVRERGFKTARKKEKTIIKRSRLMGWKPKMKEL